MIYISTGLIKNQSAFKTSDIFLNDGIHNIELSGGLFEKDLINKIKKLKKKGKFILHNYFPPPQKPFTLNLATLDKDLFKICYNHVKNTIRYSGEMESNMYSLHAGFLIDPKPNKLGKKFINQKMYNKKFAMDAFIERINDLSIFAKIGIYKSATSINLPFLISNLINVMIDSAFLISSFMVMTASHTLALFNPFGFFE